MFVTEWTVNVFSGFATGIYATNSPDACQYVANNANCNIIVVENNNQLQKILQVWDQLPDLKAVIQYRDTPVDHPNVFSVSRNWSSTIKIVLSVILSYATFSKKLMPNFQCKSFQSYEPYKFCDMLTVCNLNSIEIGTWQILATVLL